MTDLKTKIALESLSMDLLRVALGLHRGSDKMAERFTTEALKRKREVNLEVLKPYFKKVMKKLEKSLTSEDKFKKAEDTLMYSTLVRNYCQKFL